MQRLTVPDQANSTRNGDPVTPNASSGDLDAAIRAILRREKCSWDEAGGPAAIRGFMQAAYWHGVVPLLDAEFRDRVELERWPKEIQVECFAGALAHAAHESAQREEAARVIDALVAGGVQPLVLKGGALACTLYADPSLRPRCDTDLLVPMHARAQADRVLEGLGYSRAEGVAGEFISYQASWSRTDATGNAHYLDLHWRINNSQLLANVFAYEDLASRSVPVPGLGPSARTLDPVDALLLACVHRAGHAFQTVHDGDRIRHGGDRLIWLYDIHMLAGRMSDAQLEEFARYAAARKIRAICLDALQRSRECLGTIIPPRLLEELGKPGPSEPSASLISAGEGGRMVDDFLALERWRDRAQWLRELAFPDAAYMRWKYPDAPRTWLPILYVRRGMAAISRLFRAG